MHSYGKRKLNTANTKFCQWINLQEADKCGNHTTTEGDKNDPGSYPKVTRGSFLMGKAAA
jgi:hypothetical protein